MKKTNYTKTQPQIKKTQPKIPSSSKEANRQPPQQSDRPAPVPVPVQVNLEATAQEILPGLWIGNQEASQNIKFLKSKKITCIINCTETLPFPEDKNVSLKIRVPVRDNLQKDQIKKLYSILNSTINKIYTNIPDHNILVHCHAGRQRSATVLAAYLMKFGNLTKKEAIEILRSKRQTVGMPRINFEPALDQFEVDLLEKL